MTTRPGHNAIARELETMFDIKFKVAKSIALLAVKPEGTFQQIGKRDDPRTGPGQRRRPMSQAEAKRIVDLAIDRIRLIDA